MLKLSIPTLRTLNITKKNTVGKENNEVNRLLENELALDEAMVNAYLLITGQKTYEDFEREDGFWLPEGFHELESIDNIMNYFIEQEDYEKCAVLRDIKVNVHLHIFVVVVRE